MSLARSLVGPFRYWKAALRSPWSLLFCSPIMYIRYKVIKFFICLGKHEYESGSQCEVAGASPLRTEGYGAALYAYGLPWKKKGWQRNECRLSLCKNGLQAPRNMSFL